MIFLYEALQAYRIKNMQDIVTIFVHVFVAGYHVEYEGNLPFIVPTIGCSFYNEMIKINTTIILFSFLRFD